MFRINVEEKLYVDKLLELTKEDSHYICKVLRLTKGDNIKVFNEAGEFLSSVISVDKKTVSLKILSKCETSEVEPQTDVVLAFGYLKGDKNELVVQKATELGVNHIWPVITDRTVAKMDDKKIAKKVERLQKISKEATEQCGRLKVPNIKIFKGLTSFCDEIDAKDSLIIPWEKEKKASLDPCKIKTKGRLILFIGPEGGIAGEEIQRFKSHHTISLGKRILRAETAAISATTVVMYALGELGG
ncbi:RsmE family RNA methyltransferase [Proteinivorax hydrogeniformans]|uniref:Ribosomal RNA small subunit methyltransferase E n=1 Tax=Proteinivorax hydrogeniformans TaxID=1826727 RepID=A0AAU8HWM4_9FIRM